MEDTPGSREISGSEGCGGSEGDLVEHGQILLGSLAHGFGWETGRAIDHLLPVGVGLDPVSVDGKAFAADEPFSDAAGEHALEQAPQQVAVPEATVAVLGEGGMIRHLAFQAEPAEPAIARLRWASSQRRRSERMPRQ